MDFNYFLYPIKNQYADFSGRTSRKQYWMFVLFSFLISIAISIVESVMGLKPSGMQSGILSSIYSLAILLPSLGLAVRRLHDLNKSGWWFLMIFVPIVGWIVLLVFLLTMGDQKDNQFGKQPKPYPKS